MAARCSTARRRRRRRPRARDGPSPPAPPAPPRAAGGARARRPQGLWARTAAPPREGNALEVLIDGANALPQMAEAIRGAQAPRARLLVEPRSPTSTRAAAGATWPVRELLAEAAERVPVRVLVWAGAPGAGVQAAPRRRQGGARAARAAARRSSAELDSRGRAMHCHHEKIVIVDDELAFVGGIDLTALAGDRYDSNEHPHKEGIGWHDASSQLRGPIVRDVAAHFALRWEADRRRGARAARRTLAPAGDVDRAARPHRARGRLPDVLPRGEFSIAREPTCARCVGAQRLIYLENQFLWSPEIVEILEAKLRDPPSDDFRVVVLLPHKANNGQDDTRGMLGRLVAADDGGQRFLADDDPLAHRRALRPALRARQDRHRRRRVAGDRLGQPQRAQPVQRHRGRRRHLRPARSPATRACGCGREHLERADVDGDPARVVDEQWRPIAAEQLERRRARRAAHPPPVELPGVSRRSRRLTGPARRAVVDG